MGRRVVVKFRDEAQARGELDASEGVESIDPALWGRIAVMFPGITSRRLLTSLNPQAIDALMARARDLDRNYRPPDLLAYMGIECPDAESAQDVADTARESGAVEFAYVENLPGPPPQPITPDDEPLYHAGGQGHLKPAPDGIDALAAWKLPGGTGTGVRVLDIEVGWMLTHEDLVDVHIPLTWGKNHLQSAPHGTASLGVLVAADNGKGGIGIAPNASASVVSEYNPSGAYDRSNALLQAIAALEFGDVLLLEMQATASISPTVVKDLPAEIERAVFDLIRLATALGITVVEPAGNGPTSLDIYQDANGKRVLDRSGPDFQDSGAIIVAAAKSLMPHAPSQFTNWGNRVDCYAWGDSVGTCWTDTTATTSDYTTAFAGTSSASAIIAGVAVAVQGLAEASLKRRLSAWQLRDLLRDPANGTPAGNLIGDALLDPGIGIMPDLAKIAMKLSITPDLYVRDYVGDTGDPHQGAVNASPDIIVRANPVPDGQLAFGQGSGTEDSPTLSEDVKQADNVIYVRVRNRGSFAASTVRATVSWAPVATLVTPDKWTTIGWVDIPTVPGGNILSVSPPLPWAKATVPPPGHYCFVAIVGNSEDPAPSVPSSLSWKQYLRLIRDNNNITWRNFQVVSNAPTPSGFTDLRFLLTGDPEFARTFRLQVLAGLPSEAQAWLELPVYLLDRLGLRSPSVRLLHSRTVAWLPVNPSGRTVLGETVLPGNTAVPLQFHVSVPEHLRDVPYDVAMSQVFEGDEIGRVTWRLVPPARRTAPNG